MHHDLKLMAGYWEPKLDGTKPWEYRSTEDRDFCVGDTVTFHEVTHDARRITTGRRSGTVTITYVLMVEENRCVFTHTHVKPIDAKVRPTFIELVSEYEMMRARIRELEGHLAEQLAVVGERNSLRARVESLELAAREMLCAFTEHGHPGRPAVRSSWIDRDMFEGWNKIIGA